MRPTPSARAGFTLAEMIGVVVIAAVLLAVAVPALTGALRVREAEAVLRNDLRNAANAYEEAFLEDRAYPAFPVLATRGLRLSPGVALDSQAVAGERVYVRLRHEPTGQRCALDYSRSSPLARNRADCWGGGQGRDTALIVTAGAPPAPPADTFGIEHPAAPEPPANPLALAAPEVSGPGDATAAPGTTLRPSFVVTNRSALPRTFRMEAGSSDPAVVAPPPGVPARITLLPGVPTAVAVLATVAAGAPADAAASVTLVVTDDEDARWRGTGAFTVAAELALAAPRVALEGAAHRTAEAGETVDAAWTVTNRTNAVRTLELSLRPGDRDLLGVETLSGTGRLPFAPGETRTVAARLRLSARAPGGTVGAVTLVAADAEAPAHAAQATLSVEARTVLAPPALSPPADRTAAPGTEVTATFRLTNRSNVARRFTLAASSGDPEAIVDPKAPAPITLPAHGSADVRVTARVADGALGGARAAVTLRAVDADAPQHAADAGFHVVVAAVHRSAALSWAGPRVAPPGADAADTATLANRSNVAQEICLSARVLAGSAAAGRVVAGSPAAPGCVTLAPVGRPGAEARIRVSFRVADDALAGWTNVVSLTAAPTGGATPAVTADLPVEAALVLADPAWTALPPSPLAWEEGEARAVALTLRNPTNAPRRFCVALASSDVRALAPAAGPACGIRVGARDSVRVAPVLRAAGPGTGVRVTALAYDEGAPERRAEGAWRNDVRATRPVAVWDAPAPVYVRRWATFDGSRSHSPVGAPIVRYHWSWGLVMQRWDEGDGTFVYTGDWETARDSVADPVVRRAFDLQGTFDVCLTVEDGAGRRSEPSCRAVTALRSTVARPAWRYRGWWTYHDWCFDVWWSDQCDQEHGNARWELDLRPSLGDVALVEAEAEFRVRLHNTDDPDRSTTVTYRGDAGTIPAWGTYAFGQDAPEAVGSALLGRWRVLSTRGTGAQGWPTGAAITDHPLVLNVNLASATGLFDGGPHWVPDDVWVTLRVRDADGRWTSATAYHAHDRDRWRQPYDTVVVDDARPQAGVAVEETGPDRYRVTGSAESPEGRIVETGWEITYHDLTGRVPPWTRTARGPAVEVLPGACERIAVTFRVRDDHGTRDEATAHVTGSGGSACAVAGGPGQ